MADFQKNGNSRIETKIKVARNILDILNEARHGKESDSLNKSDRLDTIKKWARMKTFISC
jgi:hypothetical protein